MKKVVKFKLMSAVTDDTNVTQDVSKLTDIGIIVIYTRVSGSGAGTLTLTGTMDADATDKYALGIRPLLTGTLDSDGVIAYTTSTTVAYTVDGSHKFINVDWNETTNPATCTVYIVGVEAY